VKVQRLGEVKLLEKKEINLGDIRDFAPDLLCLCDLQGLEFTKETDRSFGLFQGSDSPKSHGTKSTQTFLWGLTWATKMSEITPF